MSHTVLVIDDDQKLNALLKDYLGKFKYRVSTYTHPKEGLQALRRTKPDLVILDVMLPEQDGFEVCKQIRKEFSVPIIMLTARGDVMDRVVGLELGADDYLAKPFEPRELVARIQSVLRRGATIPLGGEVIKKGKLTIDLTKRVAWLDKKTLDLTTMEFEVLHHLMRNPGRVLSRDQLLENIRGLEWEAYNRSVDVLISRLRQKLKDNPKRPRYLKTVWGSGYQFMAGEE